jgi:hypothetical protein
MSSCLEVAGKRARATSGTKGVGQVVCRVLAWTAAMLGLQVVPDVDPEIPGA